MAWFTDPVRRTMSISLVAAVLLLIGKSVGYVLTGSTAMLADAAEGAVHLVSTILVAFGLWVAIRPPDADHPYGHGKAAYLTAGFEGMLLVGTALLIVVAVMAGGGGTVEHTGVGLGILAVAAGANVALGRYLIRTGRRTQNLALQAHGAHVLTDVWTTTGVFVGVGFAGLTGWAWVDPVVALLVAAHVAWVGTRLLRQACGGLMERVDDDVHAVLVDELDAGQAAQLIQGYHQLRHRCIQDQVWAECHLAFPNTLSLAEAHDRAHALEARLQARLAPRELVLTTHLEPETHDAAHPRGHQEPTDPLLQDL